MGGKCLKFPKRGKFVDQSKFEEFKEEEEQPISEEEHNKRLEMLKSLGLVK
jgi:hypothetical protein